jgi:hypothetical protein
MKAVTVCFLDGSVTSTLVMDIFSLHFLLVLFLLISIHCFHICYPFLVVVDVIEEDALNEKSCIQVSRILITKADTEIDELEQDLVSLQSQLAWAEHEEWPELCCKALTEKINCLDISLRSLKNTDENDIEVQLLMHKEPAERVHGIVRVLLTNYFQEKMSRCESGNFLITFPSILWHVLLSKPGIKFNILSSNLAILIWTWLTIVYNVLLRTWCSFPTVSDLPFLPSFLLFLYICFVLFFLLKWFR